MSEAKRRRAETATSDDSLPADIKRDIAKAVRSIEWMLAYHRPRGLCFFRAMSGTVNLNRVDILTKLALGGMIYRAGSDEKRDAVNAGTRIEPSFLGYWFVMSGDDIVEFSVRDDTFFRRW